MLGVLGSSSAAPFVIYIYIFYFAELYKLHYVSSLSKRGKKKDKKENVCVHVPQVHHEKEKTTKVE